MICNSLFCFSFAVAAPWRPFVTARNNNHPFSKELLDSKSKSSIVIFHISFSYNSYNKNLIKIQRLRWGSNPQFSRQTVGRINHSPTEPQTDGFQVSVPTYKGAILAFRGSPQLFSTSRLKYHVSPEPTLNKVGLLLLQVGAFSLRFSKLYPQFLIQLGYSFSTVIAPYCELAQSQGDSFHFSSLKGIRHSAITVQPSFLNHRVVQFTLSTSASLPSGDVSTLCFTWKVLPRNNLVELKSRLINYITRHSFIC